MVLRLSARKSLDSASVSSISYSFFHCLIIRNIAIIGIAEFALFLSSATTSDVNGFRTALDLYKESPVSQKLMAEVDGALEGSNEILTEADASKLFDIVKAIRVSESTLMILFETCLSTREQAQYNRPPSLIRDRDPQSNGAIGQWRYFSMNDAINRDVSSNIPEYFDPLRILPNHLYLSTKCKSKQQHPRSSTHPSAAHAHPSPKISWPGAASSAWPSHWTVRPGNIEASEISDAVVCFLMILGRVQI